MDAAIFRGRTPIALPSPTRNLDFPLNFGSLVLHYRSMPYFCFDMPPQPLNIRICTASAVLLGSTTGLEIVLRCCLGLFLFSPILRPILCRWALCGGWATGWRSYGRRMVVVRRTLVGALVRVWQLWYGLYLCSLLRREIYFFFPLAIFVNFG